MEGKVCPYKTAAVITIMELKTGDPAKVRELIERYEQPCIWDRCGRYGACNPKEKQMFSLTQQPIEHVDATPDNDYPLRILKAYRKNCDCKWSRNAGNVDVDDSLIETMNRFNDERAKILDKAIIILENEMLFI